MKQKLLLPLSLLASLLFLCFLHISPPAREAALMGESRPLPIIMYHSVLQDPDRAGAYVVSPDTVRQDILYLQNLGYTCILPSEAIAFVRDGGALPEKPVLITFDDGHLKEKIASVCAQKNVLLEHLYHKPLLDPEELLQTCRQYREMIRPYVAHTTDFLQKAIADGKRILLEGQLGALKDTDHGIYPMVTSSSTLAGFGSVGAGIPPYEIKDVITVVKAYSSAVGAGPFVS